ncbi:alpha/beta hydrolase [Mycobacterium sp. 1423905.2]|uniref:alpha/beta hydrolase n=1 Tax=Mycobacterium sp. 1423905.2 TaxID=1856859 RepID=UPI00080047C1|nr:alpha/beta fold hydrolase [Mycobacterium sp. 1423905.2]OBJ47292.1 alpha/beta hydrolase [Mycobacterium sp. 1423905.2]
MTSHARVLRETAADDLVIIDKLPSGVSSRTPLLFVHGGGHAAWCWDEYFLDFFAANGFRAVAVNLRGHGGSSTSRPLRTVSIADYVDDLAAVIDYLTDVPVLIGHSLGGFVVQKYLESHQAPAGVLLASAPPHGLSRFLLRSIRRHPWLMAKATVTGNSVQLINTPGRAREAFFSVRAANTDVARWAARFEEESPRALLDTMVHPIRPQRVSAPMLVLGAGSDRSITTAEVRATARAYRTEAEIFAGMAHDMMLEPGWRAVAERIEAWVTSRGL